MCCTATECQTSVTVPYDPPSQPVKSQHFHPSIDVRAHDGRCYLAWTGQRPNQIGDPREYLHTLEFAMDQCPFAPTKWLPDGYPTPGAQDETPSAAISDEIRGVALARTFGDDRGMFSLIDEATTDWIECCNSGSCSSDYCFTGDWQPCMAMTTEGYTAVTWAKPKFPNDSGTPFDIALRLYDTNGTTARVSLDGPGLGDFVNNPDTNVEPADSRQVSPAVDVDENGNVVVAWVGPRPVDCSSGGLYRVYARHFVWNYYTTLTATSAPFIVNSDLNWTHNPPSDTNPTVSLVKSSHPGLVGRFIVGWNAKQNGSTDIEIRAQYFQYDADEALVRPIGVEFLVNQDNTDTQTDVADRRLAESAQHTMVAGHQGQVVAVWTASDDPSVHFTILPPDYPECQCAAAGTECLKGDTNDDEFVDGQDVDGFIEALVDGIDPADQCLGAIVIDPDTLCPYDVNCDCVLDDDDIPCFVTLLLGGQCGGCGESIVDCNTNGIEDAADIFNGTSRDCNTNFIPDECDIADTTSDDANTNGLADECEDCNSNSIADSVDIAGPTSDDLNTNGIPDECEGLSVMFVDIELQPYMDAAVTRCIEFALWNCNESTEAPIDVVEAEVTFPSSTPHMAEDWPVLIPSGDYTCVTARDPWHTLRSTSPYLIGGGPYYAAAFVGDRATGGHWLVGGNVNGNNGIAATDLIIINGRIGRAYSAANTDCTSTTWNYSGMGSPDTRHADVTGDGVVLSGDYSFAYANLGLMDEDNCCTGESMMMGGGSDEPEIPISVAELMEMGVEGAEKADMNTDGIIDMTDLDLMLEAAEKYGQ